ncbi:hypothetical protein HHK36_024328 [Tetracentron sinense]|uniref:CRM domain-containing protein n=1 Tax=Tetracentron sinense TaxID=13715 RepID=A0A835D7E0_TETSI|nr:hypothetical protein HHK36_024328 [Tetracentron sinense]
MLSFTSIKDLARRFSNIVCKKSNLYVTKRNSLFRSCCLDQTVPSLSYLPKATSFAHFSTYGIYPHLRSNKAVNVLLKWQHARYMSNASITLETNNDVVRFCLDKSPPDKNGSRMRGRKVTKRVKMSKKAKLNELRFYRLKAKKKMTSPNPEVRIRYKLEKCDLESSKYGNGLLNDLTNEKEYQNILYMGLLIVKWCWDTLALVFDEKTDDLPNSLTLQPISVILPQAKRKEAWLMEKLRKFEVPKAPAERYDPEILTEEEKFYLKRTGEKKKNYVPIGRRGVFGGVVLNMHLHWKKHETVKVVCKPCKPGQVHEYAEEIARLSKGIVIDIKANNIIIFYRGKNYVQPKVMSPTDTLSKNKALEKYKFEQSLEHTGQFIEKLEKELEEYHKHLARYRKGKETVPQDSVPNI